MKTSEGRKMLPRRKCGICGVEDIPRGVDWQWWKAGRPVHFKCVVASVIEHD